MRARFAGFGLFVAVGSGYAFASQPAAHAAGTTITVTTAADDTSTNSNCSLREALQAANTDHTVDACPAGRGAHTVGLSAHTYAVHGELDVQGTVTIRGASAKTTGLKKVTTCPTCGL